MNGINMRAGFWQKEKISDDNSVINSLVNFKNELIGIVLSKIKKTFAVDFEKFEPSQMEYIELSKAIIRCFLRYNNTSINLVKQISKKVLTLNYQLQHCSMPYPIIHFPDDTSEIGKIHTDGQPYINQLLTTWIPLNNCFHKPIMIVNGLNSQVTPNIEIGEFLMWDGATKHEGLINQSDNIHITLVTKFTSEPLLNERTATLEDIEKFDADYDNYDMEALVDKFTSIYIIIRNKSIVDENPELIISTIIADVDSWKLTISERQKLSFMLTLFSQRMEPHRNMVLFYLYSIAIYSDNFLGLQKAIHYFFNVFGMEDTKRYISCLNLSKQTVFAIKTSMEEFKNSSIKDNGELLNWTK